MSSLQTELNNILDTFKQTDALIARLARLHFQPGSEPLDGATSVRIELAQDIHDSLKQLEEDLELLRQSAEDLTGSTSRRADSDPEKVRLAAQLDRLDEDLRGARGRFRRAQLTAKRASEAAKQKERELVFATLQHPSAADADPTEGATPDLFAGRRVLAQKSKLNKEELEVDASSNVTTSLRRTHDLLSTELSRSRFAEETFEESTAALEGLGEHYSSLDSILSNSRELLGTLLRSQKSDTWYLETAFYLLVATLGWLIFRRILLGPFIRLPLFFLRWFVWKPLYLFLTLTGILHTDSVAQTGRQTPSAAGTRTPLIIQPSAEGGAAPVESLPRGGVPVGAGGPGAKAPLVEKIGRMAEESARQSRGEREEVTRGDGTVLPERGEDEPKNPKKKAFEADVEDAKQAERKAEERQSQPQHQQKSEQRHKRDEL